MIASDGVLTSANLGPEVSEDCRFRVSRRRGSEDDTYFVGVRIPVLFVRKGADTGSANTGSDNTPVCPFPLTESKIHPRTR